MLLNNIYQIVLSVFISMEICLNNNLIIIPKGSRPSSGRSDRRVGIFLEGVCGKGVKSPSTEKPDLVLESIRRHCGPAKKDADQVNLDLKENDELKWEEKMDVH